jgi:hypothetical protein
MGMEELGDFHPIINEWTRVVPGSGEGVEAIPGQSTYESQTFPTSSLFHF